MNCLKGFSFHLCRLKLSLHGSTSDQQVFKWRVMKWTPKRKESLWKSEPPAAETTAHRTTNNSAVTRLDSPLDGENDWACSMKGAANGVSDWLSCLSSAGRSREMQLRNIYHLLHLSADRKLRGSCCRGFLKKLNLNRFLRRENGLRTFMICNLCLLVCV